MNRICTALALLLVGASTSLAADWQGVYDLEGRYSTRRKTAATFLVNESSDGRYLVSRRGRYTSDRYKHLPEFNWVSEDVVVEGDRMLVTYSLSETRGMSSRLRDSASDSALSDLLDLGNRLRAVYFLRQDGSIRELIVNRTREAPEGWWRTISSAGQRRVSAAPSAGAGAGASGSGSEFTRKAFAAINAEYREFVDERYDELLDFADTPSEEAELRAQRREDREVEFERLDEVNPDELMDDALDSMQLRGDDGQVIPRDQLEVWQISVQNNLTADQPVGWTFVFDRRTGELVHQSDLHADLP